MLEMSVLCSVLGVVAGFLAGLFGIGGGLVIVPALSLLMAAQGFTENKLMVIAVATSLATIIFTAVAAIRAHHRRGAVVWEQVRRLVPGIALGTAVGSVYAEQLSSPTLRMICAVYLLLVGVQMALRLNPALKGVRHSKIIDGLAGVIIGFMSALLGIGGGTLLVPFLVGSQLSMQQAVATSSACGLPIALVGTIGYIVLGWQSADLPPWSVGYVYLPAFGSIVLFSMLTAPLGAKLAHRLPGAQLKRYFSLLLFIVAFKMLSH